MEKKQVTTAGLQNVTLTDGYWAARQAINREKTIPAIYNYLESTGRLAAFDLDKNQQPPKRSKVVRMFFDSDSGKWLEAVAYSLMTHPDPALENLADDLVNRFEKAQKPDGNLNPYFTVMETESRWRIRGDWQELNKAGHRLEGAVADDLVNRVGQAQQPDGYLNTYVTVMETEYRWRNLRDWHEMYNAGHLIEGAVAYYQATGKRKVLDILTRFADLIDSLFGPDEGKRRGYPGHPELELALVKLYRETGEPRYLKPAQFFIEERGQQPHYFDIDSAERGEDPADFWAQT